MCVASASVSALGAHIVAIGTDLSLAPQAAVLALPAAAAANAACQVISGALLDRASRPRLVAPLMVVAILGLYFLTTASSAGVFALGGALVGIASGSEWGFVPIAPLFWRPGFCRGLWAGLRGRDRFERGGSNAAGRNLRSYRIVYGRHSCAGYRVWFGRRDHVLASSLRGSRSRRQRSS